MRVNQIFLIAAAFFCSHGFSAAGTTSMNFQRIPSFFLCLIVSLILLQAVAEAEPFRSLDDLGGNRKIDGYRGIWFTLGQFSKYGDKFSGGLATNTANRSPLAIYVPKVDKTFFVYGGTTGENEKHLLCMIGCFDHASGTLGKPTVVCDKNGVNDPHDNPCLCVDGEGYLWVFVAGRGTIRPGFKYKSVKPYDIDSFERISVDEMCYPQPKFLEGKGFLNLFTKYRGGRQLYFQTSSDGAKWSEDHLLAAMKRKGDKNAGHYQISDMQGERIGVFFNWHPNGNVDFRTNIYYIQTTDFGKTWTDIRGNRLSIPVTDVDSSSLVEDFFSRKINVYLKDMTFDEHGNPIALFVSGTGHEPGPEAEPREWGVVHWNGDSWKTNRITNSDHNYDSGSIGAAPGKWCVIAPTENRPQPWGAGGELVRWESSDEGRTWSQTKQITIGSPRNHNYVRKVVNGKSPFQYFWADGDPDRFSKSELYFGDIEGNVRRLPYTMIRDAQLPEKVLFKDSVESKRK